MEIRQILFATDLSEASDRAFSHVLRLAERFTARVLAYHAMEIPSEAYADWGGERERQRRLARAAEIQAELERRCRTSTGPCEVVVQRDVVTAALHRAIRELAAERRADLVVMATHARSGVAQAFVGSVTSQLLHEGVRPLLCVPPAAAPAGDGYQRLLVPTDLSVASRRALPWAALLAHAFGSAVVSAYVAPPPTLAVLSGLAAPSPVASSEDLRRFLEPELRGLPLEVEVAGPARAWSTIVRLAGQRGADLVVMSSCGHDSVGDHVLGSATDRVIRHSPVPVLVA